MVETKRCMILPNFKKHLQLTEKEKKDTNKKIRKISNEIKRM